MTTATVDTTKQAGQVAGNATNAMDSTFTEREPVAFGFAIGTKNVDGKEVKTKTPVVFSTPEDADKLDKEGKASDISVVDVVVTYPKTWDALIALPKTDEEKAELVNNHNRGARNKVTNRMRAKLLAIDDETGQFTLGNADLTNGALDLTAEILSESKRKVLTQDEKFDRFVKDNNIAPDKAAKMKAVWLAATA